MDLNNAVIVVIDDRTITQALAVAFCIICLGQIYRALRPFDATDAKDGKRSGLVIFTDHGTGLQYVSSERGGLTPRLDDEGEQMIDLSQRERQGTLL